jgi:O-antigen ligase
MSTYLDKYKETFHVSVNLYSLFLIATFIPDVLHIDNVFIKHSFWVGKVLLACWVIFGTKHSLANFSTSELLFIIVSFVYIVNLYYDIFVDPLYFMTETRGSIDFTGFCLGIIIAFSFRYDPAFHSEKSFNFFWISLTVGLILAFFLAFENLSLDAHNVRYDANSTINSIMYGQTGCALSLISIYGIVVGKNRIHKLLFLITFVIGLASIAKAGSRSPVVVLVVVSAFYFLARLGTFRGIIIFCSLAILTTLYLDVLIDLLEAMGSNLAVRLNEAIVEGETSGRDNIYKNTLKIIDKSPIFGAYYVIPSGIGIKGYPHNFFLEVFLATGMLGGIPFMLLILASFIKAYKFIKANHPASWLIILYIQIVCYGMFSTGLYTAQDFWALLFFMLSMKAYIFTTPPVAPAVVKKSYRELAVSNK